MSLIVDSVDRQEEQSGGLQEWLCQPRSAILWLLGAYRSGQAKGQYRHVGYRIGNLMLLMLRIQYGETTWTLWDRFELDGNPTLQNMLDWFKDTHNLDVQMVSQGVSMLWSSFVPAKKVIQRRPNLKMKLTPPRLPIDWG